MIRWASTSPIPGSASSSRFDAVLMLTGKVTLGSAGFFSVSLEGVVEGDDFEGGAVVSGGGEVHKAPPRGRTGLYRTFYLISSPFLMGYTS